MDEIITLDYGSGGKKTSELIEKLMLPAFHNPELEALGDGAVLPQLSGEMAFSTDSFVIDPIFFPGGDIGKLAVCGTVNDLAMCGAVPKYLSLGAILEEGLPLSDLERIIASAAKTAARAGVRIVTGDTKVVERGRGDKVYLNTAGIGVIRYPGLSPDAIRPGDKVLLSGTAGDHGTAVMLARSELGLESSLQSDCMPLGELAAAACEAGGVRVLRDPTRGGVATTLNEFCEGRSFGIELIESAIPVREQVRAACDLLGLDPLYCANEGKMLCIASPETADAVLAALRATPGGEHAAEIGQVSEKWPGKVVLRTDFGGSRILTKLTGAQLPRIC
jgi:hydrogenase expression/formation protein HypE